MYLTITWNAVSDVEVAHWKATAQRYGIEIVEEPDNDDAWRVVLEGDDSAFRAAFPTDEPAAEGDYWDEKVAAERRFLAAHDDGD